jgi:hypothetical protein
MFAIPHVASDVGVKCLPPVVNVKESRGLRRLLPPHRKSLLVPEVELGAGGKSRDVVPVYIVVARIGRPGLLSSR